jgi:hypothetical protein
MKIDAVCLAFCAFICFEIVSGCVQTNKTTENSQNTVKAKTWNNANPLAEIIERDNSKARKEKIHQLWNFRKQAIKDRLRSDLSIQDYNVLYQLQQEITYITAWAVKNKDKQIIHDIFDLIGIANEYITEDKQIWIDMGGGYDTLNFTKPEFVWSRKNTKLTLKTETILYNAQFLFSVAQAINAVSTLNVKIEDKLLNKTIAIVASNYKRWVLSTQGSFEVQAWGCNKGRFNHYNFLLNMLNNSFKSNHFWRNISYCNAVNDTDLWILGGVVELLAYDLNNAKKNILTDSDRKQFQEYLSLGGKLLNQRLSVTKTTNFQNQAVSGADFDVGAWDDHPTNEYAGVMSAEKPSKSQKKKIKNTSWDISHAFRFVIIFETFARYKTPLNLSFPDTATMQGFANQLAYTIFNKNFKLPLFTNYFNGGNGWQRIDDEGRGFGPYMMSNAFLYGGYGYWAKYNPDILKIEDSIFDLVLSNDTAQTKHRNTFYGSSLKYESPTNKTTDLDIWMWLQFLTVYDLNRN